jgi:hypothetical protein
VTQPTSYVSSEVVTSMVFLTSGRQCLDLWPGSLLRLWSQMFPKGQMLKVKGLVPGCGYWEVVEPLGGGA